MPSHIHELWEELHLPEEYPELDPEAVLARVSAALSPEERSRERPMKKKLRLTALLAATLVLLTATVTAAYRAGVLDLFFRGDTSQLEPYVRTVIDSAENGDYRLSVDSALYDGQNLFAVITVTGLTDQAAEDLMSNRVIAESHRASWGEDMVESLLASGSTGPDTFSCDSAQHPASMGVQELTHPTDTSRSWRINIQFPAYEGPQDTPLELWLDFMGRGCAVSIPLDSMIEPIRITPNEVVTANVYAGWEGVLQEFVLTPTSYSVTVERIGDWDDNGQAWAALAAQDLFFLRMKDGTVLTREQLGESNQQFETVVDLTQVASIIYGYTEFPVDGTPSFPAQLDEHLYPFVCSQIVPDQGLLCVPIEELCQKLGADYFWDEETQTGTATYRGVTLVMPAGSSSIYVDGEETALLYDARDEAGNWTQLPQYVTLDKDRLIVPVSVLEAWNLGGTWLYNADHVCGDTRLVIP